LKEKLEEEADKKGKQQQVWGEVIEEEKAVSKISREKIDGSRQMTIFDFGFTRSQ
jgi:vacuolar-type H+-ATPase subunit I/STV1